MIDAIDRAIYWAAFALMIAGLGALAFFFGLGFWNELPIVWDGSWKMWFELWLGLHAIGFFALTTFLVCSAPYQRDMINNWMVKTARERARDKIWFLSFLTFSFGFSGLIPDTVGARTPLWLDLLLTSVGGFGMYRNSEPENRNALAVVIALLVGLFLVLTSINNQSSRAKAEYSVTEPAPASAGLELPCFGRGIEPIVTSPAEVPQPHMPVSLSSEWLGDGLYGNDNDVARLGPVTITGAATSGYRVKIRSQSEFRCGLTADADGNPSRLTTCTETTGR